MLESSPSARAGGFFPPGPPPARNVLDVLAHFRELQRDVLGVVGQRFAVYGDFLYGKVAGYNVYHGCHPELIHEVLVNQASSFRKRTTDLEILGKGLLTSDGETWRRQRRRIQPAFRHHCLAGYGELIADETRQLIGSLAPGQVIELRSTMMELTLRVVCRTLFGQHFAGDGRHIARAVRTLQEKVVRPKLLPPWLPTPHRLLDRRMTKLIDREVFAIIDRPSDAPGSLLAQLREASDEAGSMTREQLRDEVVTLFLAGHETTALALSWALYLLSLHRDVAVRVKAEVDRVAGAAAVSPEHFPRLELTLRVIKEAMRLYPPVYVIPRIAAESVRLLDYTIPPGSEVWLWIYFMQRDPRWYHLPDRFDPERFLPDGEHSRNPLAYAPFGQGTRTCIGRDFALLEAVIVLAALVQRFRMTLLDSRPVWPLPRVTLAPGRKLAVRLETA